MKNYVKYVLKMALGFSLYALGLVAFNLLYKPLSGYKYILFLMPVLPLIYMVTVIIRFVLGLDEMMRKAVMEGMAFAGLATAFTCFSLLFVSDLAGMKIPGQAGFYIYWFYYTIGIAWSGRRYR
jgi:hypothetical protein